MIMSVRSSFYGNERLLSSGFICENSKAYDFMEIVEDYAQKIGKHSLLNELIKI